MYIHCLCVSGQCTTGDVRLVNGNNTYEGRLELCSAGIWGTVCSFGFGLAEAIVVCTQLNLTSTCKCEIYMYYIILIELCTGTTHSVCNMCTCTAHVLHMYCTCAVHVHVCMHVYMW